MGLQKFLCLAPVSPEVLPLDLETSTFATWGVAGVAKGLHQRCVDGWPWAPNIKNALANHILGTNSSSVFLRQYADLILAVVETPNGTACMHRIPKGIQRDNILPLVPTTGSRGVQLWHTPIYIQLYMYYIYIYIYIHIYIYMISIYIYTHIYIYI